MRSGIVSPEDLRHSFGPVPSRRLGRSLGINNIPSKACTFSCVYCQVGRTDRMEAQRRSFYDSGDIVRDVERRLEEARGAFERVDFLAFVPDGEPTLDRNLGKEIRLLKACGVPVGVITNGSLLWREEVRDDLEEADWVSVKVDAVREEIWRKVNRPHKSLPLERVLQGILDFSRSFEGELATETMLVRDLNDGVDCIEETAGFLAKVRPRRAYLAVPIRPPAESQVRRPAEDVFNRAYQILAGKVKHAECLIGYEGDSFAATGDVEKDLLSITSVHPMREEAVGAFLSRAGSTRDVVDRLVTRGHLARTEYDGHVFYLRRFPKE